MTTDVTVHLLILVSTPDFKSHENDSLNWVNATGIIEKIWSYVQKIIIHKRRWNEVAALQIKGVESATIL